MPLYLFVTEDDSSSTASVLLYAGQTIDDFVSAISDLGGTLHALVATAGRYTLAGLVELPDDQAAVALRLVQSSLGRSIELVPAIALSDFGGVIDKAGSVMLRTSGGDTPPEPEAPPS
jgi:uncharacterized protein with GYD domain